MIFAPLKFDVRNSRLVRNCPMSFELPIMKMDFALVSLNLKF